jgi:hypothetical protein
MYLLAALEITMITADAAGAKILEQTISDVPRR